MFAWIFFVDGFVMTICFVSQNYFLCESKAERDIQQQQQQQKLFLTEKVEQKGSIENDDRK